MKLIPDNNEIRLNLKGIFQAIGIFFLALAVVFVITILLSTIFPMITIDFKIISLLSVSVGIFSIIVFLLKEWKI